MKSLYVTEIPCQQPHGPEIFEKKNRYMILGLYRIGEIRETSNLNITPVLLKNKTNNTKYIGNN